MKCDADHQRVMSALKRVWGYDTLRPLQAEAIEAGLQRRDALVVMPTGGGKSLCYQIPPLVTGRTDVVVSPLIALMKDQVDGLQQVGYPAAALHSGLSTAERNEVQQGLRDNAYRLIFVAPERVVSPWFLRWAERLNVHAFAIDEAHCISQWGHDFRPEYRQLAILRQRFPEAGIHAYTATATPRVRQDIIDQLQLREPAELVGRFDRPNLTYRILPQVDREQQVAEVVARHPGEAVIVYCLSRRDTESMAATLRAYGVKAEHYHAGMEADDRRAAHDRFAAEKTDVVVATIAFGMGIDRSNVRAVIHACLPKSIESYQQETGRAGRDGLPAECVLLYSQGDVMRLERLIDMSAANAADQQMAAANLPVQKALLGRMQRFATAPSCRHAALSEYFGQPYESPSEDGCGACDVCLGEVEGVEDSTRTAQMILSCVARVKQGLNVEGFGVGHIVEVLAGANTQRITRLGHDQLSTHGLMKDVPRKTLQNYIYQLFDQGLLDRTEGDYPVVKLNEASVAVLKGERRVQLVVPKRDLAAQTVDQAESWEGVDRDLYEHLRELRREIAAESGVPAYTVFLDRTLMELARIRPSRRELLERIHGIGERKSAAYGPQVLEAIARWCDENDLAMDVIVGGASRGRSLRSGNGRKKPNPTREQAVKMFAARMPIEQVAEQTGRARSTVMGYLAEWVAEHRPATLEPWVDEQTYKKVSAAIRTEDVGLRPIRDRLGGEVPYDAIRLVLAHRGGEVSS
jgi:ATP-dependent DNA helicase RecQ